MAASLILRKIIDAAAGLRVRPVQENEGLDVALHGEAGYNLRRVMQWALRVLIFTRHASRQGRPPR